jgi:antitoxin (DNA-binding transcriptional repressor) of toxin-antitoxin stability system
MTKVKIATLKNALSMHIRAVEGGASFTVTDRDRPVAQLVPVEGVGGFELVPAVRPFATLRKRVFVPTKRLVNSLALLIEERGAR